MIQLILKSYFSILVAVAASCVSVLLLGIYLILRKNIVGVRTSVPANDVDTTDLNAIAGDDLFATQLDLARAFIESGRQQFAKKILETIVTDGNVDQQEEAKLLLAQI